MNQTYLIMNHIGEQNKNHQGQTSVMIENETIVKFQQKRAQMKSRLNEIRKRTKILLTKHNWRECLQKDPSFKGLLNNKSEKCPKKTPVRGNDINSSSSGIHSDEQVSYGTDNTFYPIVGTPQFFLQYDETTLKSNKQQEIQSKLNNPLKCLYYLEI